jgi:hypothetical protein
MDHAWYQRDVAELQGWRRVACYAWGAALSCAVACTWLSVARYLSGIASLFAAVLGPSEWFVKGSFALAFAAATLPPTIAAAALIRPSSTPLHLTGGVDPWGVFAPPGSKERWVGATCIPPHLFPPGFSNSQWVRTQAVGASQLSSREMARDALGFTALFAAHVGSGAAACALLCFSLGCGGGGGGSGGVGGVGSEGLGRVGTFLVTSHVTKSGTRE